MIATTFENTAEIETPKEEKKQSWLQSAFNAVANTVRSFDNWLEYKFTSEGVRQYEETERQEEIKWLYENVYVESNYSNAEEFKLRLENILKLNAHRQAIDGKITIEDLTNYHMVLSEDKKAELDQLRTEYKQETTLEI